MKIKDLKQILSQYDEDMDIYIDLGNCSDYLDTNIWESDIRNISNSPYIKRVKDGKITQRAHAETKGAKKCLII